MNELEIRAEKFISWLRAHGEDRGMMADLRRGFSPRASYRSWPWLAPWCDLARPRERTIVQVVAAGYATHSQDTEEGNLGAVCRAIVGEGLKSFDGLFRRFLACHTAEDVCRLLPGLIRAAKSKGIPINYRGLYADLFYYSGKGVDVVRSRWAAGFWGAPHEGKEGGKGE